jgi:3-oxoacyl-[acyl-carrier protein] reductase
MDLELEGRVALVAAGTSGIGLGAATALAREGATVEVCGRSRERLDAAVAALRAAGPAEAGGTSVDLRDPDAVDRWVEAVAARHGGVDVVVANSGGTPAGHPGELSLGDFRTALESTFLPVVGLVQAALPHIRRSPAGRIVIVSAYVIRQPVPGLALSNSVRPGILGYAKSLVHDLGAGSATVNVVAPGLTLTPLLAEYADEVIDDMARAVPLGRAADPIEIGDAVAFLASARAAFVTGAVLGVDGGAARTLL